MQIFLLYDLPVYVGFHDPVYQSENEATLRTFFIRVTLNPPGKKVEDLPAHRG